MGTESPYKAEMDFRDLLRRPAKLFGYTYLYFLAILIALGYYYVSRLTDAEKNEIVPFIPKDTTAYIQDIPYQSARVLPPVDITVVALPTPDMLRRGRELFSANCASCHGDNGLGDGPAGLMLTPRPRNFHSPTGWTYGSSIAQIYKTLEEGIVRNGMASYNYLPPADRFALIHQVRSWQSSPPKDTEQDLAQLETLYHLSRGTTTPGQIPVRDAMARIVTEHGAFSDTVRADASQFSTLISSQQSGAGVLKLIRDPQRVFTCFPQERVDTLTQLQFMRMVSADPLAFGFQPAIAQLPATGWVAVYSAIIKVAK